MKALFILPIVFVSFSLFGQNAQIDGSVTDETGEPVVFANIGLYQSQDSTLMKVASSNENGQYFLPGLAAGEYYMVASYLGYNNFLVNGITLSEGEKKTLKNLSMSPSAVALETSTVTANRSMVVVSAEKTTFNVEGTINSTGEDALSLMRKAPGVMVDNNDNINVLGRSGVIVQVDGKAVPLSGEDLSNYLKNISSNQIDQIDIISNPGAKYDAEGNAGIIDIRLKRDKSHGTNGSVHLTYTQGRYDRWNGGASLNHRSKNVNVFGSVGGSEGTSFDNMFFGNYQNGLFMDEKNLTVRNWNGGNARLGVDVFLNERNTIGVLANGWLTNGMPRIHNEVDISGEGSEVDSVLIATTTEENQSFNSNYNLNYKFEDRKNGRSLNVDFDYGRYRFDRERLQQNDYYNVARTGILTTITNQFETPSDIDIYTARVDYEDKLWNGKIGVGAKFSDVGSDNTFLVYNKLSDDFVRNDTLSNVFVYDEQVLAGYINYNRPLNQQWSINAGLRMEQTDAEGHLTAFLDELNEDPVTQSYMEWFPSAGISWQPSRMNAFSLNYGRRINRPNYHVLNPFNNRLSEISYEKGNPHLRPEIVNNIELSYTHAYMYNFKIGYSKTTDQITRLIGPDENDPRAGFITWDNLSEQTVISGSASLPLQLTKSWSAYVNASASYKDNQADYGDGAIVDVQAFSYSLYAQNTINLFSGIKAELSGWYSGPGIWGGVFEYDPSWSVSFGLQKRFFEERLNAKVNVNDIFYESGWDGVSSFNGLRSTGSGRYDSRSVSIALSYDFGNKNVKSRNRKTGIEDEAGRVGG